MTEPVCETATSTEKNDTSAPDGVDKSGERVQKMFGEISHRYDFLNHVLSGGIDFAWRRKTVRTIPPTGEAPILDVCTGTGDLAIAYWKKSQKRVSVIGTDFTHEMIQLANAKSDILKRDDNSTPISFV